ncbi:helix-turn-helix domain-containing protein [Xanthomonas citri]|nr:helix-turn-helix transcriptional regulator [Xanthomonas citri]
MGILLKSSASADWPNRRCHVLSATEVLHRMPGRPRAADSHQDPKPVPVERLIFARNFRQARKAAKLSQRDIRDRTGLTRSWISNIETGKSPPNLDNMAMLAKCVGVPLWKLLVP